jgi:hypothetical protein
MKPPRNPCPPTCPKRSSTCHGTCEDYLAYWSSNHVRDEERVREGEIYDLHKCGVERSLAYSRSMKGKKH